jgi:hypothetical protein
MALLSDAAALARGRILAIALTAALPLAPAFLIAGGTVFVAAAGVRQQFGAAFSNEAPPQRTREAPPVDSPSAGSADFRLRARQPDAREPTFTSMTFVAGALFAALVVLAGLFLAQAALLHVAAGAPDAAAAWACVAVCFRPLAAATGAALVATAVGSAACLVPGFAAALAFSLAAPVAAAERIGGFAALQRSWMLVRRVLPAQVMLIVAAAIATVALTQGLGRLLPERAVLAHALVDAGVAVVVLPLPAFVSVVLYLRERARLEGRTIEELRQYILRMSAPG